MTSVTWEINHEDMLPERSLVSQVADKHWNFIAAAVNQTQVAGVQTKATADLLSLLYVAVLGTCQSWM